MPNATQSRFGALTATDLARVQAEVAKAAKVANPEVWRSWTRILFTLQEAKRDG